MFLKQKTHVYTAEVVFEVCGITILSVLKRGLRPLPLPFYESTFPAYIDAPACLNSLARPCPHKRVGAS